MSDGYTSTSACAVSLKPLCINGRQACEARQEGRTEYEAQLNKDRKDAQQACVAKPKTILPLHSEQSHTNATVV